MAVLHRTVVPVRLAFLAHLPFVRPGSTDRRFFLLIAQRLSADLGWIEGRSWTFVDLLPNQTQPASCRLPVDSNLMQSEAPLGLVDWRPLVDRRFRRPLRPSPVEPWRIAVGPRAATGPQPPLVKLSSPAAAALLTVPTPGPPWQSCRELIAGC